MLSFECIKNEKSVYFLLTSAFIGCNGKYTSTYFGVIVVVEKLGFDRRTIHNRVHYTCCDRKNQPRKR